jgi:hypothetical protein
MLTTEKEVTLTVNLGGVQTRRGSYTNFVKAESGGLTEGVITDKEPVFSEATEVVHLREKFVLGALVAPPERLKMSLNTWLSLPENKRIGIHVKEYIEDLHPDHQGYTYEILH